MSTTAPSLEKYERKRTRGLLSDVANPVFWGSYNSIHNPADVNNSSTVYSGKAEVMHDTVTPGYDREVADGQIVNSAMSRLSQEIGGSSVGPKFQTTTSGVLYTLDYGQNWMQAALGYPTLVVRPAAGYQDLLTEVETRARAGIAEPDFNGLVSLGELRETLAFLRNPFKTGLELARTFQKRKIVLDNNLNRLLRKEGVQGRAWSESTLVDLRGKGISSQAEKVVDKLSSLYLEFRFGVMPLLKDAEGIALALDANGRGPRLTSRSASQRVENSTDNLVVTKSSITYNYTDTVTRTTKVRSMFLYEHFFEAMSDTWGLSAPQVPKAVWELIPLSFVVDRFINVGSFISALVPQGGTKILASCTAVETTQRIVRTFGNATYTWPCTRQPSGSLFSEVTSKYRRPWVDAPGLTFRTDNIRRLAGDTLQILDLLTLTLQRIR